MEWASWFFSWERTYCYSLFVIKFWQNSRCKKSSNVVFSWTHFLIEQFGCAFSNTWIFLAQIPCIFQFGVDNGTSWWIKYITNLLMLFLSLSYFLQNFMFRRWRFRSVFSPLAFRNMSFSCLFTEFPETVRTFLQIIMLNMSRNIIDLGIGWHNDDRIGGEHIIIILIAF